MKTMAPKRMLVAAPLVFASLAMAATSSSSAPPSSNTSVPVEIEAIQAHFKNAQIVPELLATFNPVAYMALAFDSVGGIQPGQSLDQTQVTDAPTVTLAPANGTVNLENGNYTLIMADAGPVGTDETQGQTRHWLVNDVTITGSSNNETVSNSSATAITAYAGPAPPSGSGPHRYVVMLFKQPANFTSPSDVTPNMGVGNFSLTTYLQEANLTGPAAANYFQVEVGTATASLSPTSAVVTSTLPVPSGASTTASGSGANKPGSTSTSGGAIAMHEAAKLGLGTLSLLFFTSMAFVFVA